MNEFKLQKSHARWRDLAGADFYACECPYDDSMQRNACFGGGSKSSSHQQTTQKTAVDTTNVGVEGNSGFTAVDGSIHYESTNISDDDVTNYVIDESITDNRSYSDSRSFVTHNTIDGGAIEAIEDVTTNVTDKLFAFGEDVLNFTEDTLATVLDKNQDAIIDGILTAQQPDAEVNKENIKTISNAAILIAAVIVLGGLAHAK